MSDASKPSMASFAALIDAARESTRERLERVEINALGDYSEEDYARAQRQARQIEVEITLLEHWLLVRQEQGD